MSAEIVGWIYEISFAVNFFLGNIFFSVRIFNDLKAVVIIQISLKAYTFEF